MIVYLIICLLLFSYNGIASSTPKSKGRNLSYLNLFSNLSFINFFFLVQRMLNVIDKSFSSSCSSPTTHRNHRQYTFNCQNVYNTPWVDFLNWMFDCTSACKNQYITITIERVVDVTGFCLSQTFFVKTYKAKTAKVKDNHSNQQIVSLNVKLLTECFLPIENFGKSINSLSFLPIPENTGIPTGFSSIIIYSYDGISFSGFLSDRNNYFVSFFHYF